MMVSKAVREMLVTPIAPLTVTSPVNRDAVQSERPANLLSLERIEVTVLFL